MSPWLIGLALWVAPAVLVGMALVVSLLRRAKGTGEKQLSEDAEERRPESGTNREGDEVPSAAHSIQKLHVGADSHSAQ